MPQSPKPTLEKSFGSQASQFSSSWAELHLFLFGNLTTALEVFVDGHWDFSCTLSASKMLPKTGTVSDLLTVLVLAENYNLIPVSFDSERLLPGAAVSRRHNFFSLLV